MKKICWIVLAFVLVCTGCQKTPEEPIVVGKDQQQMIEKAQGETVYVTDAPAGVDWAQRLGAPKKYEARLTSAEGHLTVDVDATVTLPEGELPVVRVSPYLFTDEDVRRYARALLGEELRCVDPLNENARTRAMWEKEILELKNDLDHWEEYGSIIWDSFDSSRKRWSGPPTPRSGPRPPPPPGPGRPPTCGRRTGSRRPATGI